MAAISLNVTLVAVLCMVFAAHYGSEAAITCGSVSSGIAPCLNYLKGTGPLTPKCCSGISSVNKLASTTPDRQQACKCLKSAAGAISGLNYNNAAGLPGKCGVSIPYKISPSTDCATVR